MVSTSDTHPNIPYKFLLETGNGVCLFAYALQFPLLHSHNTRTAVTDAPSRLFFGKLECGSLFAFSMLDHPTGSDVELSVARMKFMRLRFFSPWSLRPRAGFAVHLVAPYAADVRCAVVLCVYVCVCV
jgi:hypothetical protein